MKRLAILLSSLMIVLVFFCSCEKEPEQRISYTEAGYCYPEGVILTLPSSNEGTVYYTTDGSVPDCDSLEYVDGIVIKGNGNNWLNKTVIDKIQVNGTFMMKPNVKQKDAWIIKASRNQNGKMLPLFTRTIFTDQQAFDSYRDLMVISLVMDIDDLLDFERGIMVKGRHFAQWCEQNNYGHYLRNSDLWYQIEGNYSLKGKDWERPVSIELFDLLQDRYIQIDGGIRIHGGASRMFTHKSFRLYFREKYGKKDLDYDLFMDDRSSYDSLILRNGGNAGDSLIFKDSWQQSLLKEEPFLTQRSRPAVVYLNGEYWGVYCLNERYTSEDLQRLLDLDDVLIVKEDEYEDGDEEAMYRYDELLSFEERDLSDPAEWEEFKKIADIENMAAYFAAQVYMANCDLKTDSNIELWCSVSVDDTKPYADGKWRFMLFDTELSSGLYDYEPTAYNADTLSRIKENYPLFASMLRCEEFKERFIKELKRIGSEVLCPARINESLEEWSRIWLPLLKEHFHRFEIGRQTPEKEIRLIKNFYARRYDYIVPLCEKILETGIDK